jgi:hypothetical protein
MRGRGQVWTNLDEARANAKTDKAKLEIMVAFFTESHLDIHGGYPHDYIWIGDTLVIADLDDGKDRNRTQIVTYKRAKLLAWYSRAEHFSKKFPDESFSTCLHETYPNSRKRAA